MTGAWGCGVRVPGYNLGKMPRVLIFPIVALAAAATGQDRPTFRANVSQVHVDAEVLGKDGRMITGLTGSDFRVFDEGQEQPLVAFAADEQPLDLMLLFDTSGSMRSKVEKVSAAAGQALHELKQGDRVALLKFSNRTHLVSDFTTDLGAVERDIHKIVKTPFRGGTLIYQALYDAASFLRREVRTGNRRAILIITDNLGTRTRREKTVVSNLWEADALVSGLIVRERGDKARRAVGAVMAPYLLAIVGGMDRIAEKTGGDVIHTDEPGHGFPEMMRRIRSRYSLYYATPEGRPGSIRTIRVELSSEARKRFPEARVHARRGYELTRSQ